MTDTWKSSQSANWSDDPITLSRHQRQTASNYEDISTRRPNWTAASTQNSAMHLLWSDISTQFRSAALVDRNSITREYTRVRVCLFVGSSPSCPHTVRWARYHVAHLPRPPSVVFHRAASAFVQTRRDEADAPLLGCVCLFRALTRIHPSSTSQREERISNRCWLPATPFLQLAFLLFVCSYHLQNRAITRPSCADFCCCASPSAAHFDTFSFFPSSLILRHL
jgi:hypothetical protein